MKDELGRNGYKAGVISDSEASDLNAEIIKVYLGNTNSTLSQSATVGENDIRFLQSGNSIALTAGKDENLPFAVYQLLSDCLIGGELVLIQEYQDKTIAASAQTPSGWQLSLPAYTSGTLDTTLYSCGYGKDASNTNEKSTMQIINNTTAEDFSRYMLLLEMKGYKKTFENAIDGNRYASYTSAQGDTFYMYYLETVADNTVEVQFNNRVHIIHDRSSNVSLEDFCYTTQSTGNTEFFAFNLNTAGEDTLLIHTADNAWIMIDGGMTDWENYEGLHVNDPDGKFADSIYQFMREKSNLKDGEKLVISAWYLTHAHRDHCLAFGSMIERNHEGIELQRIMANVPDTSVIYNSNNPYFLNTMNTVNTYYPNVKFLKAHAGMEIRLADVEFTVLMAQENLIHYWVSNKDEYNSHWKNWSDSCTICGGDCRLYYKMYDFNNSSIVTKIKIGDMTILSTGDAYRIDRWMVPYYSLDTLNVDILKVAHHFNNHEMVANNRYGSRIDRSKYYWKLLEARADKEFYAIVTNANYDKGATAKTAWQNAFANNAKHHFVESKYDTVYGFKKVNGSIVMTEYDATYSYAGGVDNTAQ